MPIENSWEHQQACVSTGFGIGDQVTAAGCQPQNPFASLCQGGSSLLLDVGGLGCLGSVACDSLDSRTLRWVSA
jgi:hypothetical protein